MISIKNAFNSVFFPVIFSLFLVSDTLAQECTESEQTTQDTCVDDALTTCLDVAPACQNRVATADGVRTILIETCCCKGGSLVTAAQFNACRLKKKGQFRRAAKIFPLDFRTSIKTVLTDLSADDCTACDF